MPPLLATELLSSLEARHREALLWFLQRTGRIVSYAEIEANHIRLVSKAEGIYKPAQSQFALSVRQTLSSPYSDLEPVMHEDGSWTYLYFRKEKVGIDPDTLAQNIGLKLCQAEKVPVGVLIQTTNKYAAEGTTYRCMGLALVTIANEDGYFCLDGFGPNQTLTITMADPTYEQPNDYATPAFDPWMVTDERAIQTSARVQRQGQGKFRKLLLELYDGRCAVTGCEVDDVLEAAHIVPYMGQRTNDPGNGLILRSDVHRLFDCGLLGVDSTSRQILLSPKIARGHYSHLMNRKLLTPKHDILSWEALRKHAQENGLSRSAS